MPTYTQHWTWDEAFDKFGFGDGDAAVFTHEVAAFIESQGYKVDYDSWGLHNTVIRTLVDETGKEWIDDDLIGYYDPRDYLPARLLQALTDKFGEASDLMDRVDRSEA